MNKQETIIRIERDLAWLQELNELIRKKTRQIKQDLLILEQLENTVDDKRLLKNFKKEII